MYCPASMGSYQHHWRLHRKMLHTVEVWQSILVQVRQAPGSPQALVRATHLTHGRIAHAARFTSLSHQNVKESKWVHLITLIIYSRSPPPKNLYHPWGATPSLPFGLSSAPVPVAPLLPAQCAMLIPTLWPLTNTPLTQLFLHPPAKLCMWRESRERVVGIGRHAKTGGDGRGHHRH